MTKFQPDNYPLDNPLDGRECNDIFLNIADGLRVIHFNNYKSSRICLTHGANAFPNVLYPFGLK